MDAERRRAGEGESRPSPGYPGSGTSTDPPVKKPSEGALVELHQRQVGGLGDRPLGGELRQHGAREELCGRDLALVERLVAALDLAAELRAGELGGEVKGGDTSFYEGKVAAAQFFARTVLPKLTAERAIAESTDLSLMELDESAF